MLSEAKAQAVLVMSCVDALQSLAMAEAAIASRRGTSDIASAEHDHAVFERFCALKSLIVAREAAAIAASRGVSHTPMFAKAHGVFERF
jgi:hypothetical protein